MQGDLEQARLTYAESIDVAAQTEAWVPLTRMLSLRAVLQMDLGDWASAADDVERSQSVIEARHLSEYGTSSTTYAAAARLALHRGDLDAGTVRSGACDAVAGSRQLGVTVGGGYPPPAAGRRAPRAR